MPVNPDGAAASEVPGGTSRAMAGDAGPSVVAATAAVARGDVATGLDM